MRKQAAWVINNRQEDYNSLLREFACHILALLEHIDEIEGIVKPSKSIHKIEQNED
jgi:hypothetical protein